MGQASSSSCSTPCSQHCITHHPHEMCNQSQAHDLTSSLPDECLASIFDKLSCHDKNSSSLVCKRWKYIDSISRQRLVLLSPSEMSHSLPGLLTRFTSLSILSLKCSRKLLSIDDFSFSRIPIFLPSLSKLKLKGCTDISDDGLRAFSLNHPVSLSKISFASCGFGAAGLNSLLTNCPSLVHLTLKRLRKLDAHNTPLFDEKNRTQLNIVRLCIKDLHNARIFTPLLSASAQSLKTLIVCRSSGNWDKVFQSLQEKTSSSASISEIQIENVQMGDAGLIAISALCPQLQVLQLSRTTDCTDDGLSAIAASCKSLRKLHIDAWSRFGGRTISNDGVLAIGSHCLGLQELVLMGVPVSSLSLTLLASNCRVLERLALCNSDSVGDSEMGIIAAKFIALKKLCIKNCPITESGIEAIGSGCPNLVKLKVKRCRAISEASVRKLRVQRSSVVVSVDRGSMVLLGERMLVPQDEEITRIRAANTGRAAAAAATDVICSSRSAFFLKSRFENALQLGRRRRPS
ncbi:putative F-box/LRR-repeat protein 8 [Mercurialis annua]|uniref:putative F-box/LRR-repeat protein 8 n=1 Tax=Mercurialis annua TaxID=3986 RepID=UPI00215F7D99|nr:putative F-box/LRR-repeat protein 8 [Mercurialis annua]